MIRLAVHGAAGRMGARTCSLACNDPRFGLVAQIDLESNTKPANNAGAPIDAVIDFSSDEGARNAARIALEQHASLLVGTTGLSRQTLADIEVAARTIPVMIAPNTSLGVAVMNHLAAVAAGLLAPRYGVNLIEAHHTGKQDAPSGTALRIADTLRRAGAELPAESIHAIRSGDVVGEHTVEFAGGGERIRICHMATSRDLFARGALEAAAWLHGQPPGRYTIEQALGLESA
ncbi:MAG: 4-hydroxy-tetrahydrodipicolinate reductase [Planctomycetota bacterium]